MIEQDNPKLWNRFFCSPKLWNHRISLNVEKEQKKTRSSLVKSKLFSSSKIPTALSVEWRSVLI